MKGSVRKKKNKWYYYFDVGIVDGKRKKIERSGGDTKKEALKALRDAIAEYEDTGEFKETPSISYADYLDYWFENYVQINCKFSTIRSYESIIRLHLKPNLGNYQLKSVTAKKLQEFLNQKYINGFSKNFLGNMYGVLSGSLKYAVQPLCYIKQNPMSLVKMPTYSKDTNRYEKKYLSSEDLTAILDRFNTTTNFYIPIQIAIHTGMRAGEVCSLTWDDIDFDKKQVHVNSTLVSRGKGQFISTPPKTKSSLRSITVGDTLIKILRKEFIRQKENKLSYGIYYTENKFVCRKDNGQHITTDSLRYLSRVVNYELNINFNFHSFRHGHATMLLENGANFKDIQKRLGHAKLSTTMDTYSHVTSKMTDRTVEILEAAIGSSKN
jgi:integrase